MSYIGSKDWQMEVRFGNVSGISAYTQIGHTDSVGTSLRYVHHEMNTGDLSLTALYDTPATVKVASTSGNDVNTTGTGAWQVLITGYDGSNVLQTETVNLNGTTEVTSSNTYKFVRDMTVTSVGTTGSNEGVIWCGSGTFTAGVPATKYLSMQVGTNLSRGSSILVEAGKAFWPQQLLINLSDTTRTLDVRYSSYNGTVEYEVFNTHASGSTFILIPVTSFGSFAAGTLIGVQANVSASTAKVTVATAGVLKNV